MKPLYDVIGKIPGSTNPDEWVIRGNHHDAWVNGAEDPISGMVAVMEEARALGELVKQGWKPKRTMIYCAWDGEEPGLLGSTEWVETHVDELRKHAVMYINSDSNSRGYFELEGSHTLEHFINDVARDIQDPETKLSDLETRAIEGNCRCQDCGRRRTKCANVTICDWICWAADRIMRHSSILRGSLHWELVMAERTAAEFIIRSTMIFTGTPISAIRISFMAARSPKRAELP